MVKGATNFPFPLTGKGEDRGVAQVIETDGHPTFVLPRRGRGMNSVKSLGVLNYQ